MGFEKKPNKKPMLLAPAGDMECFTMAMNAGADAVYLAGDRFGARAYAGNFTRDEIITAIGHAHLLGRQVHLTVNTLIKQREIPELLDYIRPLYEAGLDACIIQDLGAASLIKSAFPEISLHASTQMTITGKQSALFAKNLGFSQVVLARECSLSQIKSVCEIPGLDTEVFIHGAMCYCYSGQCLFSSMLGERSANRGRCAGPCRLEYDGGYVLSLADLCGRDYLHKLVDVGVNCFKIEGRMKNAAYVAGCVGVYRKLLDGKPISEKDEEILNSLYHRGEVAAGYLKENSLHHPVTLKSPAYRGSDGEISEYALKTYGNPVRIPLDIYGEFTPDMPSVLRLGTKTKSGDVFAEVRGAIVQRAKNAPLPKEKIEAQLGKLGGSLFTAGNILIRMNGEIFCPIKDLNELRRQGVAALEEAILRNYKR